MYLLIIGAPRSGTTLLATMIGMHSDVAMLIEDRFFSIKRLTGKKILANKLCIPIQLELNQKANYYTRGLQKAGFLKNHSVSKFNLEDYLSLGDIKIICIIRESNHVVRSIMKRGKKQKEIAIKRWSRAIEIINDVHKNHPDKTAIISYEDLVQDSETSLKKLCSFLDIEFQQQMLEGYKYNILYPGEKEIDKSRAHQSETEVVDSVNDNSVVHTLYNKLSEAKI